MSGRLSWMLALVVIAVSGALIGLVGSSDLVAVVDRDS